MTGSGVATVIAGSLLAAVLPGILSPKHRVVADFDDAQPRLAATFFFQPRDEAKIADLNDTDDKRRKAAPTYAEWKKRAYGRYYKATQSRLRKQQLEGGGA